MKFGHPFKLDDLGNIQQIYKKSIFIQKIYVQIILYIRQLIFRMYF